MVRVFTRVSTVLCLGLGLGLGLSFTAMSAGAASLVSADEIQRWHVEKDEGGPTFSGSPAWLDHMAFVEAALRKRGVVDLTREKII